MSVPRPTARPEGATRAQVTAQVSMRDLLASCAAAKAVSTPPPAPVPAKCTPDHREAA
ncbi:MULTISPECIES: hypothetical protein [unclassified Streptomyces]|uniref:hypothetical protein n=1 Tax=unclassified Streptomyces TaxID=2593676 RepID=UPI002E2CAE96|nr:MULTISPECIES: hypothetical protein [unclassified Streptomyces]WUB87287.1 hypothetical protein OG812_12085 [Streptomyces sp. NBC_00566]